MEIIDIISHYIDKSQNLINVEFRTTQDDEDVVREDFIEYSFFEEFGFDNKKDFEIFESIMEDEEDEWDDEYDYIQNEDTLISFLNEYYVVYPKKIPKPEYR
jgi:predicted RNA methylase